MDLIDATILAEKIGCSYVAVDGDGSILAFTAEPTADFERGQWHGEGCVYLGEYYEEYTWNNTLTVV